LTPLPSLELPEPPRSAELSGQGRADRTRDLLVRLLRAVVGKGPAGLVVEDAHWLDSGSPRGGAGPGVLVGEDAHLLDSASTGLVLALSRERMPLLLVVATRSQGESRTIEDELGWAAPRGAAGGARHRAGVPALGARAQHRAARAGPAAHRGGRGPGRPASRRRLGAPGPDRPGRGEDRRPPGVHREIGSTPG